MNIEIDKITFKSNILKDKTIVISGAGSGIGRQAAKSFSEHGANLILLSKNIKKLETLYDEIIDEKKNDVII